MRQKERLENIPIEDGLWKRVLRWQEEPVLTLSLRYPKLPDHSPGLRRVGRYYRQVAEQWQARWEVPLFRQAAQAAEAARAASRPFSCWEAKLDYTLTHKKDGLLSLYLDAYEYTGGAHGLTVRQGDVWELPSGTPRSLRSFFPPKCRFKKLALAQAEAEAQARLATGEYQFYDDWPRKLELCFDPERFYLTEEGPVLFYPLYAIAPYVEGIITFPVTPPARQDDQSGTPPPTGDGQPAEKDH